MQASSSNPTAVPREVFYLNGVLITCVVAHELGPNGYVVIELRDADGCERVTRIGRVEMVMSTDAVPHEYAGASLR